MADSWAHCCVSMVKSREESVDTYRAYHVGGYIVTFLLADIVDKYMFDA